MSLGKEGASEGGDDRWWFRRYGITRDAAHPPYGSIRWPGYDTICLGGK